MYNIIVKKIKQSSKGGQKNEKIISKHNKCKRT